MRKYFGGDGTVVHPQMLISKHLVTELLTAIMENEQTPQKNQKDTGMQIKTLPGISTENQSFDKQLPRLQGKKRIDTKQRQPKTLSITEFTLQVKNNA